MGSGGRREGSGRKKKPESLKYHTKTFCIDKYILDWMNEKYGKKSHSIVRSLLRKHYEEHHR